MDFLFHNISEKEKEDIKKQVQEILDSFSKKLSKIESKEEENDIERDKCEREEGGEVLKISKEIMFRNAPDKNEDFIIAEKKKW